MDGDDRERGCGRDPGGDGGLLARGRRRVATLIDGDVLPRGDDVRTWDGRNGGNRGLASGLYLARLRQGPRSATTKISLIR